MINLTIQISYNPPFSPQKKKSVHFKQEESLLIEAWPLSPMHGGPPCQAHLVWLFSCYGQNFLFRLLKILKMLSVFLPRVRRSCIGIEGRVHLKPWSCLSHPNANALYMKRKHGKQAWNVKPRFIFACECENVPTVDLEMAATMWSKKMNKIAANVILSLFWVFFPVTILSKQVPFIELSAGVLSLTRPPMILILIIHHGLKKRTSQNHHTLCNLIWRKTNIRGHGNSKYFLEGQRNIFGRMEKHDGLDVRWINCRRPVPNPPKSSMRTNSSQFWAGFWFVHIHSKGEKVCGTAFSVKKNCGKSA